MVVRVPNKTKRRHPDRPVIVPLTPELHEHLLSLTHGNTTAYVCPRAAEQYLRNGSWGRSETTDRFMKVLELAGIRAHKVGTGKGTGKRAVVEAGFHSFRHTWVTTSEEAGIDEAAVRAVVGWGSPAMARVYSHIGKEHLRSAMEKRSSLRVATVGAPVSDVNGQKSADPAAALAGMSKADLERLLMAVEKKIKDGNKTP